MEVRSFPPETGSTEEWFSFLTDLVFSAIRHGLRSESQHASVWMDPEEQTRAGPQRINGGYKPNKKAEKDLQVTEGIVDEARHRRKKGLDRGV